ncbi:major facilitator superfamily domain-containing protein [Dichotomocladium elegans]|nr:major facilitator superfamily domain-containing protein [Dichotomocladium elegans]
MAIRNPRDPVADDLQSVLTIGSPENPPLDIEKPSSSRWPIRVLRTRSSTMHPSEYPPAKKRIIVGIVALAAVTSPLGSAIYFPAMEDIEAYFQTTDTIVNASLSVYTLCLAFFPLIWATFGDQFGRRPIYIASFSVALIGMIGCALSINPAMFIGFRAVSAIGASSVLASGAGTISDIYEAHERGTAFATYMIGPLLGPALGPIIGGYLNQGLGWRSIFWFLAILCFCTWVATIFFLPETRRLGANKDEETAAATGINDVHERSLSENIKSMFKWRWINPVAALGLLRNTNIALTVGYLSILFFAYYILNTNFTRIYTNQYGLSSGTVGLFYLPAACGFIIGSLASGRQSDKIYVQRVNALKELDLPINHEVRIGGFLLYASVVGQMLGFAGFGWCVQYDVHYAYGLVCLFFSKLYYYCYPSACRILLCHIFYSNFRHS